MRNGGSIPVAACTLLLTCAATAGEMRTWTSSKGSKIEAEMVNRAGRYIYLRTADGRQMKIAIGALDKFVSRHFATNVMDYKNNNGTKAAAEDGAKLAEKYKDTRLAELFRKMGEKAPAP